MKIRIIVSVMCFTLAALAMVPQANADEFKPMHPDSAGCGELLWRSERGFVPLPLVATDVSIDVTGPLVKGTIRQKFTNPTTETIEALYIFPMPDGAAVDAMELLVGERRIVSIVQEKVQARRTYEKAKAAGKKAALVESIRANLFTMAVAGIEPGQTVTVKLQYLDQAEYSQGSFHLTFPLTFTPRYFPPALLFGCSEDGALEPTALAEDAAKMSTSFLEPGHPMLPQATISVNLEAGIPLNSVTSASHSIIQEAADGQIFITPAGESISADRDFLLSWTPQQNAEPLAALFSESRPDGRYGLLMIVPGIADDSDNSDIPTETLFLIDVSGSMSGASIRQARAALQQAVDRLGPADRFNLMAFNNDSRMWRQSFQMATGTNVRDARIWIRSLKAENGTEMHGAMLRAMTQFLGTGPGRDQVSRRIILMTDAAIGNEDQLLRDTASKLVGVRLHVVGIGSSPNRYLVKRLANQGGGLSAFVNEADGSGEGMDKFLATINRPLITNPQLIWEGAQPAQTFPSRMPELYAGQLFLWSGKFPDTGNIKGLFTADFADEKLAIALTAGNSSEKVGAVAVRWARMKVADQMSRLNYGDQRDQVRQTIIATALEFGLVTRFTSRVAVEEIVTTDGIYDPHKLVNGLPHGSAIPGVLPRGGTFNPLLRLVGWLTLLTGLLLSGFKVRSKSGGRS